jgi:hypothetical protein
MDEYFERSQAIKREIMQDTALVERIRQTFLHPETALELGSGTKNHVRATGRTASGLYLALRRPLDPLSCDELIIYEYEVYCAAASGLWELNKQKGFYMPPPPSFCIGVLHKDRFGLLTEDLSEEKQHRLITCKDDNKVIRLKKGKRERFYVDIESDQVWGCIFDELPDRRIFEPEYLLPEHAILL